MTVDPRVHRIRAAQPYRLVFATISGAYLCGFRLPDPDFDRRGAHPLPWPRFPSGRVDARLAAGETL
jgi:hypothetical protein